MTTYAAEFKEHLVAKMLPPNHVSVPQLVRETGIPRPLYGWRRQAVGFWAFASDHRDRLADTCQPREICRGGGDGRAQRVGTGRVLPA
ncbi:MAG: hypothetical protein WAT23_12600 [Chromatiaceae bacterium]